MLEAAVRSFKPIEPLALRWEFPIWVSEHGVDTSKLKDNITKQQRRQQDNDKEGFTKIMDAIEADGPATPKKIEERTGISRDRLRRLLNMFQAAGNLAAQDVTVRGNATREYRLPEGSIRDVGGVTTHVNRPRAHVPSGGGVGGLKRNDHPPTHVPLAYGESSD